MGNIIFERRIWQLQSKCAICREDPYRICEYVGLFVRCVCPNVCLCVHLYVCVCVSVSPAVGLSVGHDVQLIIIFFAWVRYLPSATRNPLLQKLKLLIRWSWSHSGSEHWTAWSCGGEDTCLGGAMFDCQEIMSCKFPIRLTRIWLATSSLELNNLLKQNKVRLVLQH